MDKGSFLIKPLMNWWDYGACARKSELDQRDLYKLVHIKPGIKAKISMGLAHIVLEAKEELVSLVSVSGVP